MPAGTTYQLSRTERITIIVMLGLFATGAGCGNNLGISEEQLQPCLSDECIYSASPQEVWHAAADVVAGRPDKHILVNDADNRVISWVEHLSVEQDGRRIDSRDHSGAKNSGDAEIEEVGEGGVAISTIVVRPWNDSTLMRLRRVYYGRLTQPMFVHSRGDFADLFQEQVAQRLGGRETSNAEGGTSLPR